MDKMTKKEKAIAWGWMLEALAGVKEVGVSLLHEMIEMAPDLPEDLKRKVNERLALRCLEDLFAPIPSSSSSTHSKKVTFDLSESCENVLQRIVKETPESDMKMGGAGLLKWDIQPFIMHKRVSVPKCALGHLKYSILDGTHPCADFLIRKSGLISSRHGGNESDRVPVSDSNISNRRFNGSSSNARKMRAERNDGNVLPSRRARIASETERSCSNARKMRVEGNDANILPSKRAKVASQTENIAYVAHNGVNDSDGLHRNAEKIKLGASNALQSIEHNPISLPGRGVLGDLSERDSPVFEPAFESCVLAEDHMGMMEESGVLEDDHDDYTASKWCGKSSYDTIYKSQSENPCIADSGLHPKPRTLADAPVHATQHKVSAKESNCNTEHGSHIKVPHPATIDGPQQKSIADEGKDCSAQCDEPRASGVAPPDEIQNKVSANHDSQIKAPCAAFAVGSKEKTIADGAKAGVDGHRASSGHDGFHNQKAGVAMKKHDFLTSECTVNRAYSDTTDWTELSVCMKCNEGGQLLVCNNSDCSLEFHESCLGSQSVCYENGNFYCPFCSYSYAIKKYLQAKKATSLLKKDLDAFMCIGLEHQPK